MEEPLLVLKPNLKCAIIPLFLKSAFKMIPAGVILLILAFILKFINVVDVTTNDLILTTLIVYFGLSILPMKYKLMNLHFTRYYLYETHIISIFKFITVKRISLPYTQINGIKLHANFWERLFRSGKIALNNSQSGSPGMILLYVKKPYMVEKKLHSLIQKYYKDVAEEFIG